MSIKKSDIRMVKIFISYSSKDKIPAGEIKKYFEEHEAIECFVAHDDIVPGSEWEKEILIFLESADYFLPVQTENLSQSFWCQQETGIAFAQRPKTKIIPLIPDENGTEPIGFYAKFQGFRIRLDDLRKSVRLWLINEGFAKESVELEKRILLFEASDTYAQAAQTTRALFQLQDEFARSDIVRIVEITLNNDQILNSFEARRLLKPFFVKNSEYISKEHLEEFLSIE